MARRAYAGGANEVTLTANLNAVALTCATSAQTGWPNPANGNFTVVVNRGGASEEKMLCSDTPAGLALTIVTRGYDGTTAQSHNAAETVEHCMTSIDIDEANSHVNASQAVHGLTGVDRVVGETKTATLRNKTMDGANNTFSNIPAAASPQLQAADAAEATARAAADALLLPLAGGTMTGPILLSSNTAVNPLEPISKFQSDNNLTAESTARSAGDALAVQKAGDTMGGLLILSGPPVAALGAATKAYVDSVGTASAPGTWTAYVPVIAGGITRNNGTIAGRYQQIGKTVMFVVVFDPGTTTAFTAGGPVSITVPIQKSSSWSPSLPNDGQAAYYNGAQYTTGMIALGGGTSAFTVLIQATGTSVNLGRWTGTFPTAQASGDHWSFWGWYEGI